MNYKIIKFSFNNIIPIKLNKPKKNSRYSNYVYVKIIILPSGITKIRPNKV